ncbi:asparagine synthase (glutamine-hydrolyzing) [Algoriphagus sediminis]|uniref:asparagine synthase (glutamine-hydrolyzing) n=1 Tax=Algoriphagus sediminis TaxID=3057113 RepID=A0ABT7YDY3_9BACT|nr:asparagine synthase (glutamine-hydrolyzing) [Algoriphagus sediminis]MDN3204742.1 asparagine synthase (glutamine-hydrolyzing) [Algoriphagus sediminis]
MCGIAGIIGDNQSKEHLEKMLRIQSHRGPDFTGRFFDGEKVAIGHNRLSIIDLREVSNQPFYSDDKRFILVFNGEIYNYLELKQELEKDFHFHTTSDTEVLLKAYQKWGKDCLSRFNGMFSFAIWDTLKQKLFAARDRFGVKPFYYYQKGEKLIFSSEIPALFETNIKKSPSEKVWASFFAKGTYGFPNETFWKEIHQLPGGHYLEFENGNLNVTKWYSFVDRVNELIGTSKENEEEYIDSLLRDSIRLRFRADVPVGFNLSGGLDSSTLLGLVSHEYPNTDSIQAFTFYTGDDRYDELPWVNQMISRTSFPLNKCLLTAEEIPELTSEMSAIQLEPFGGIPTLAYAKVFKEARLKGVIVLLDGQGADESWAGYDYYFNHSDSLVQGVKSSPVKPDTLAPQFRNFTDRQSFDLPFEDKLLNLQYRDLFYTKIPRALRFNDRVSMASSTELREPFLDYRLVEYAFSRPESFKRKGGVQKYILRQVANKYLGDSITLAPKRPLQTPQREWLGSELKDWAGDRISELAHNSAWFEKGKMMQYWDNYLKGDNNNSFYIWQWINAAEILK